MIEPKVARVVAPLAPTVDPTPAADVSRVEELHGRLGNHGTGVVLDAGLRADAEAETGRSFAGVRVHDDASAAASARSLRAHAFTVDRDIYFGAAQYRPGTAEGRELIAHELGHVAQQETAGAQLQLAAESPVATPAPSEADAQAIARRVAERDRLRSETGRDALKIKAIFKDNLYLGYYNQKDVMKIIRRWADRPPMEGARMTPFDYLILAMRGVTYTVGTVVDQWTSVFDDAFHRMSSDNLSEIKSLMASRARVFKDEKALERVQFEISQEDVERGLRVGVELGAATLTGGASIVATIVSWLTKIRDLYNQAKTIVDLVTAVRAFKADEAGSFFTPAALGALVVKGLFGELPALQRLPVDEDQEKKEAPSAASKGLMGLLTKIIAGINAFKRGYNRVADVVNGALGAINITTRSWFKPVAGVYAAVAQILSAVENPGAALADLAKGMRDAIANVFGKIKSRVGEGVAMVKEKLDLLASPKKLLTLLIDKAVEWILNFLVTHPPSALLQVAFNVVQEFAGGNLVAAIRQKVPKADEFIKKIADSETLQTIFSPLQPPLARAGKFIGALADRALGVVNDVETRALGLVTSGESFVREFVGIAPAPAVAATEASTPQDFLGTVKAGVHVRLLAIGKEALKSGAVTLAKKGVAAVAAKAKAAFAKFTFTSGGQSHELWVEPRGQEAEVMVASTPEPLAQRLARYAAGVKTVTDDAARAQAEIGITTIREVKPKLEKQAAIDQKAGMKASNALRALERQIAEAIALVDTAMGLGGGAKPVIEYRTDSRGRPSTAAGWLADITTKRDDASERERVVRPLRQLAYLPNQLDEMEVEAKAESEPKAKQSLQAARAMALDWNTWIHRLDGTHLIAHVLGGAGSEANIVPFDARLNKSWIKVAENETRDKIQEANKKKTGERFYALVQAVYDDVKVKKGLTGDAQTMKNAMDLIPDRIDYEVQLFKGDRKEKNVIGPSKFPGGQIPAFLPTIRKAPKELADAILAGKKKPADVVAEFKLKSRLG